MADPTVALTNAIKDHTQETRRLTRVIANNTTAMHNQNDVLLALYRLLKNSPYFKEEGTNEG